MAALALAVLLIGAAGSLLLALEATGWLGARTGLGLGVAGIVAAGLAAMTIATRLAPGSIR